MNLTQQVFVKRGAFQRSKGRGRKKVSGSPFPILSLIPEP